MTQPLTDQRSRGELIAELYDRHAAGLFAYCLDQLGDADSAADALVAVLTSVPAVEPPRAALYALARREIYRRDIVHASPRVDPTVDPVTALIERVLRELRPHQREVLLLTMVCQLSIEELAWVLDVAPDTALDLTLSADHRFTQALQLALKSVGRVPDHVKDEYEALAVAPTRDVLARLPWRPPPASLRLQVYAGASPAAAAAAARLSLPIKPLWPTPPEWPTPPVTPANTPAPGKQTSPGPAAPALNGKAQDRPGRSMPPAPGGEADPWAPPMGDRPHERTTRPIQVASQEAPRAAKRGFVALPSWPSLLPTPAAAPMAIPQKAPVKPPVKAPVKPPPAKVPEKKASLFTSNPEPPAQPEEEAPGESTDVFAVIDAPPHPVNTPSQGDNPIQEDAPFQEDAPSRSAGLALLEKRKLRPVKIGEHHFDWAWELAGFAVALAIAMIVFFAVPMIVTP